MNIQRIKAFIFVVLSGLVFFWLPLSSVYSHGPEGHAETAFTNYDATKKV